MFLRVARRLSYLIPIALITWLGWLGDLSWWAVALLAGGFTFALDWLWRALHMLGTQVCLMTTGVGLACLMAAFYLANDLGPSLGEYFQLGIHLPRRQRLPHFLPMAGGGLIFYGLLSWCRTRLLHRDTRW